MQRATSMKVVEKQAEEPPPYSSQPPPEQASSSNLGAGTPATTVLESLDFKPSPLEIPTAAECIAHLKLLHAFARLRHEVGNEEGLFGIYLEKSEHGKKAAEQGEDAGLMDDRHQPEGVHEENTAKPAAAHAPNEEEKTEAALAERIREKRWTVFVTRAVDRFERWWDSLSYINALPLQTWHFEPSSFTKSPSLFPTHGPGLEDEINSLLPPLDVVMVWHAYMLNPRAYLEDCMRLSRHGLWRTSFPWKAINDSIDNETYAYNAPEEAMRHFNKALCLPWNSLEEDRPKTVSCPKCSQAVLVPWTRPPATTDPAAIEAYLSNDAGFAGPKFQEPCPLCNFAITHEKLRVGKFIEDARALQLRQRPLPGTILNTQGLPHIADPKKHIGTHDPFFPNRIVENLNEFQPPALRNSIEQLSIEMLKSRIQGVMGSASKVKQVNSAQFKTDFVAKESRIAVRKMLSHYWDNASPFGLDLVGAVIRQGSFVLKMRKIDWLHSPAAMATMQRLIVKYHRFVRIIADNPKKIAVPTLDVDLAWHTHQLTPKVYFSYTCAETKKFLNHDDKIPETSLHTCFQWTSTQYEKKYRQPYSECACWYCECTREPLRSSFTNRINPLKSAKHYDIDKIAERGLPKDAALGPHVSAHNAVTMGRSDSPGSWAQQRRREFEELDLQYAKVCKRYQKKKKADEAPNRETDAYVYGAYGYPMYYPMYVPYYAEPTCDGNRYTSGGCGGGCAAGTCAGSASMGSCAGGSGTPGCKASCGGHGDASGGCGNCGSGGDGGDGGGGDGGGCGGCGG